MGAEGLRKSSVESLGVNGHLGQHTHDRVDGELGWKMWGMSGAVGEPLLPIE